MFVFVCGEDAVMICSLTIDYLCKKLRLSRTGSSLNLEFVGTPLVIRYKWTWFIFFFSINKDNKFPLGSGGVCKNLRINQSRIFFCCMKLLKKVGG